MNLKNWVGVFFAIFAMSHLEAKVVSKSVPYEQGGVKLVGFLAYDDARMDKRPGVLVVGEWWGLNDYAKHRALQLAAMGYVAFAADIYGDGFSTEDPAKARELSSQFYGKPLMAERAQAGLSQLLKNDLVDPRKIAAIGFCFGGAVAQSLAYSGVPLLGMVSFHGGLVPAPADVVGKIKTRFLMLNGADDPTTTPEARAEFKKSLDTAGIDYEWIDYPGAVHAFTNPDADKYAAKMNTHAIGYNAAAAVASWKKMQDFFQVIFGNVKR